MRKLLRMTPKYLRLVYAFEFLVAVVAIFAAWSEIGGQAALDLMHWAWKLGFGLSLAASIVACTAAAVAGESAWTLRSARWLAIILLLVGAMGAVTYYYALQAEASEQQPEENGAVSSLIPAPALHTHA
jgi:hypothetical protein